MLADVQAAARDAGRLFPLTLASEGSARIGGLLGTNAGGVNVLRYGNARDLCLGVEAVMADGTVMHGLSRLVKDNMGYDLRHLLIGAEGTLGLITAASLRLYPEPGEIATAWVAVASPAAALALLRELRAALGGTISAFELIDVAGARVPRRDDAAGADAAGRCRPTGACWWKPTDGAGSEHRRAAGGGARPRRWRRGRVGDVLIAQSEAQRGGVLGGARGDPGGEPAGRRDLEPRHLAAAVAAGGVHRPRRAGLAALDPELRINCFGHLGDGNLHYNVFPREGPRPRCLRVAARAGQGDGARPGACAGRVGERRARGGAAEGRAIWCATAIRGKLAAMRAIKAALDPSGDPQPGRGAGGLNRLRPFSWGGREGARYPDWRV